MIGRLCGTSDICKDCNGSGSLGIVTQQYRDGAFDELDVDCPNCDSAGLVQCDADLCSVCAQVKSDLILGAGFGGAA